MQPTRDAIRQQVLSLGRALSRNSAMLFESMFYGLFRLVTGPHRNAVATCSSGRVGRSESAMFARSNRNESYPSALAIRERLVAVDRQDLNLQRDLMVAHLKVGDAWLNLLA
jgi:hypothetical protein